MGSPSDCTLGSTTQQFGIPVSWSAPHHTSSGVSLAAEGLSEGLILNDRQTIFCTVVHRNAEG